MRALAREAAWCGDDESRGGGDCEALRAGGCAEGCSCETEWSAAAQKDMLE